MRISPRFAVMLVAMILSIVFTIADICAVTNTLSSTLPIGINPFWKLAFVFKLLTDSVILDDFKTALDKLSHHNLSRVEEQWGGNWANLRKITTDRESTNGLRVRPNETKVFRGESQDADLVGPGIAVTTETKVESFPIREVNVATPLKSLGK